MGQDVLGSGWGREILVSVACLMKSKERVEGGQEKERESKEKRSGVGEGDWLTNFAF